MKRLARSAVILLTATVVTAQRPASRVLVIGNATIYATPTAQPLRGGTIVMRDGVIADIGPSDAIVIPDEAETFDARGAVVVAGFQNSHIHFNEPQWSRGATQRASWFSDLFEEMYTRYGFTTVVDAGSSLEDARAIRERVASGEVVGPRVLTAGIPLYPAGAIPYYLRDTNPPEVLARLLQPTGPSAARQIATDNLGGGGDIIKLFTGSWVTNERAVPMRLDIASAAVESAHQRGKLVFAHASNLEGLQVAIAAGVDVVAHALDDTRGLQPRHYQQMRARNMAMIPTLLVSGGKREVIEEVRQFRQAGGLILFGTGAGYIKTYDPAGEYVLLARAGLTWRDLLASLTTNPAAKFGEAGTRGRIEKGMAADLVILRADPARDVRALADVRATVRHGSVISSVR